MPSESRTITGHGQTAAGNPPLRMDAAECRAALEQAPLAIAWVSPEGTIVEANEALAGLLGVDANQFAGRSLADLMHDASAVRDLLAEALRGHPACGRLRCNDAQGKTCTVRCDVQPIRQLDRIVAARWFLTREPATSVHGAPRLSRAANPAAVVHRLRNSLAPMSSCLDILELDGVDPAALQALREQLVLLQTEIGGLMPLESEDYCGTASSPIPDRVDSAPNPVNACPGILIVDDNAAIHRALELLVRALGFSDVRSANTGAEALSLFAAKWPSLVLLDIGLPDLDGYAVARRIRALPGGNETMLVALSGYGQPDDRREAAASGFDEHLVKPCRLDDLTRVLNHPRLKSPTRAAASQQPGSNPSGQGATASHSAPSCDSGAEAASAATIGRLLREFVHDARTAAFPLQIHQHLLERSVEPPAQETAVLLQEYLAHCETLYAGLRRAGLLLRDEFDPHFGSVALLDVAEGAVREAGARMEGRAIRIASSGALDNARLRADREMLVQALLELIDNAVQASPDGAEILIDTSCEDGRIAISVCDSGPGIPPDQIATLPQPFERLCGKLEPLRGHIGVGLAITDRIAQLHGGRLRLENRQPHGCRVTLELPAQARD